MGIQRVPVPRACSPPCATQDEAHVQPTMPGKKAAKIVRSSPPQHDEAAAVDSLVDAEPTTDGACTLRDAVISANADSSDGDCVAGTGEDTIAFASAGTTTLMACLPAPKLTDTERTTIDGDIGDNGSRDITISGNNLAHVYEINTGAVATLASLTLTGALGNVYGAVSNSGDLTLTRSMVSGNRGLGAGAMRNNGNGS